MVTVTLSSGALVQRTQFREGTTVCQARAAFKIAWGIEDSTIATVNSRTASEDTVLQDGDVLNFGKPLAQKG